jgi:hypothetical protein
MQARVAAIMNLALLLDGALEGCAAVRVAETNVLRRRLKGVTELLLEIATAGG